MVRPFDTKGCASIAMELWDLPSENFGAFLSLIPPFLGLGSVELQEGAYVHGFICEAWVMEAAERGDLRCKEITQYGGWLQYMEDQGK